MAPLYDGSEYYKKMLELQDKLRKSEEERIRLEEKFKQLVQESRNRHDACINRLRLRYILFLEEQRVRDERNYDLLQSLDRVDNSLALMSAKTDRLNTLRKQYENYLLRLYANRPPTSVTGDSGIASQNEEKQFHKNSTVQKANVKSPRVKIAEPPAVSSQPVYQNVPPSQGMGQEVVHNERPLATPYGTQISVQAHQMNVPQNQYVPQIYVATPANQLSNNEFNQLPGFSSANQNYRQGQPTGYQQNINSQSLRNYSSPRAPYAVTSALPVNAQMVLPNDTFASRQLQSVQTAPLPSPMSERFSSINAPQYEQANVLQGQMDSSIPQINLSPIRQLGLHPNSDLASRREINDRSTTPLRSVPMNTTKLDFLPIASVNTNVKASGPLPGYLDYSLRYSQPHLKTEEERAFTRHDLDEIIKRNEHILPKTPEVKRGPYKVSSRKKSILDLADEERTARVLDNELDRYINKIRSMHREQDISLDELDHEQNTSGDLLNVTLSDDGAEFPIEAKEVKDDRLTADVEKVLALADYLATKLANVDHHDRPLGKLEDGEYLPGESSEKPKEFVQVDQSVRRDFPTVAVEGRCASALPLTKDGISNAIAPHELELDRSHQNIKKLAKQDSKNVDVPRSPERSRTPLHVVDETDECNESTEVVGKQDDSKNSEEKVQDEGAYLFAGDYQVDTGEESHIQEYLSEVVNELEPWDIKNYMKITRGIDFDDESKDWYTEKELRCGHKEEEEADIEKNFSESRKGEEFEESFEEKDAESSSQERLHENPSSGHEQSKKNIKELESPVESGQTDGSFKDVPKETQVDGNTVSAGYVVDRESTGSENNGSVCKPDMEKPVVSDAGLTGEFNDSQSIEPSDSNAPYKSSPGYEEYNEQLQQPYEQYQEGQYEQYEESLNAQYQKDPNAQYQENSNAQYQEDPNAQYLQDPNAQYQEDPNAQYQQDSNAQYQQDSNALYEEDPNAQYQEDPNAQYLEDLNVQYQEDPNAQSEEDPNAQYQQDPNVQYQENPNAQYQEDPNAQYQENQEYPYEYDQQYGEMGVYENDPNQTYQYSENAAYEQNQEYDGTQNQQYLQDQEYNAGGDSGTVGKEYEEVEKEQENSQTQEQIQDSTNRSDNENKTQEAASTNEAPKKKKDVIKSLLDSDSESVIERNASNTESDFDFN